MLGGVIIVVVLVIVLINIFINRGAKPLENITGEIITCGGLAGVIGGGEGVCISKSTLCDGPKLPNPECKASNPDKPYCCFKQAEGAEGPPGSGPTACVKDVDPWEPVIVEDDYVCASSKEACEQTMNFVNVLNECAQFSEGCECKDEVEGIEHPCEGNLKWALFGLDKSEPKHEVVMKCYPAVKECEDSNECERCVPNHFECAE